MGLKMIQQFVQFISQMVNGTVLIDVDFGDDSV